MVIEQNDHPLLRKQMKTVRMSIVFNSNFVVAQVDLRIPFAGRSIKQDSVVFFLPDCAELDGPWSVQAEHNSTAFVVALFQDHFRCRKRIQQEIMIVAERAIDKVFQVGYRTDLRRRCSDHFIVGGNKTEVRNSYVFITWQSKTYEVYRQHQNSSFVKKGKMGACDLPSSFSRRRFHFALAVGEAW